MRILPAINLKNGSCICLQQGDFSKATTYPIDPVKQAEAFAKAGATELHLVDLDGALAREVKQLSLIRDIIKTSGLKVQVGGGIRTGNDIEQLLEAGAERIIIGSLAVKNPTLVRAWLSAYGGEKLMIALDARLSSAGLPEVLTNGWQEGSAESLWNVLDLYREADLTTVLCTDIQRDGTLEGANKELYTSIRQIWATLQLQASGGINSMEDLDILAQTGVSCAIVNKAFYEGHINLSEAIVRFGTKEAA